MKTNELKNLIHGFVDKTENMNLLEFIFNIFSVSESNKNVAGEEYVSGFTKEQTELILKAFEQSEIEDSLISHDTVISRIKNEI